MMLRALNIVVLFSVCEFSWSQTVKGLIRAESAGVPISGATVTLGDKHITKSSTEGIFLLTDIPKGTQMLQIEAPSFESKIYPIEVSTDELIDMGILYLSPYRDIPSLNIVDINLDELGDDNQTIDNIVGAFQSSRDIYQRRAAFDFSQAFYRIRGYNTDHSVLMINGVPMNNLSDARPIWQQWGGLNDITRTQDFSFGLAPSHYHFGKLLGTTNILLYPEVFRSGLKVSSSLANKSYDYRLMATYNSGHLANGWAYSISGSRRAAKQGYIDGTVYDAYSGFFGISYSFSTHHTIGWLGIYTYRRRGLSAAITQEVHDYAGRRYNPYWGYQNGQIRNSRQHRAQYPMTMLYYRYHKEGVEINSTFSFQKGSTTSSRLNYDNAPNPDPTYYRKLPSYQINDDLSDIEKYRSIFLKNKQIDWLTLYQTNTQINDGKSAYLLYDDVIDNTQYKWASTVNFDLSEEIRLDAGIHTQYQQEDYYAAIRDFLSSSYYDDIDPFSQTRNNAQSSLRKTSVGDKIKYNYRINALHTDSFLQLFWQRTRWEGFFAASYIYSQYEREGLFANERYANAIGRSPIFDFHNYGIKGGIQYHILGKQTLSLNLSYRTLSPNYRKLWFNARESSLTLPMTDPEQILTADASYLFYSAATNIKLTGYVTRFSGSTEVSYFYADTGLGSDFFQEVTSGIDKLHTGMELGIEYHITPTIEINGTAAIGQYIYTNNPNLRVNFDASTNDNTTPINTEGFLDLGNATLKNYVSASGPQHSWSLGVRYESPKYWSIAPTAVWLSDAHVSISKVLRTNSFFINPDDPDGYPFPNISEETTQSLLRQQRLPDVFLLNIIGGKSWLVRGRSIGLFVVINNLLDRSYISGGYEQSRAGNYGALTQDRAKPTPSFGSKYWYGYGRSFFINVSFRL